MFRNLGKSTDQKLVELCRKGQSPAWDILVDRYKRLVYHFPVDAGLSREDCEEVFQETFLAAYQAMDKLSDVQHLGRWLAVVAQRTTWKWINNNRKRPESAFGENQDPSSDEEKPDTELEIKIQQDLIRKALAHLNQRCRKLLHLLFYQFESKDYDKVAKEAGIARGSIGPIRQRCLVKFKDRLSRLGIDEKNVSRWLK